MYFAHRKSNFAKKKKKRKRNFFQQIKLYAKAKNIYFLFIKKNEMAQIGGWPKAGHLPLLIHTVYLCIKTVVV